MDITHLDYMVYRNTEYFYRRANGEPLSTRRYLLNLFYYANIIKLIIHLWVIEWVVYVSKTYQANPVELVPWGKYDFLLNFVAYHFPVNYLFIIAFTVLLLSAFFVHLLLFQRIDKFGWSLLYDVINRNRHYIETKNPDLSFTLPILLNNPIKQIKSCVKTILFLFGITSDSYEIHYSRLKMFPQVSIQKRKLFLGFLMFVEMSFKYFYIMGGKYLKKHCQNLLIQLIMIFSFC